MTQTRTNTDKRPERSQRPSNDRKIKTRYMCRLARSGLKSRLRRIAYAGMVTANVKMGRLGKIGSLGGLGRLGKIGETRVRARVCGCVCVWVHLRVRAY